MTAVSSLRDLFSGITRRYVSFIPQLDFLADSDPLHPLLPCTPTNEPVFTYLKDLFVLDYTATLFTLSTIQLVLLRAQIATRLFPIHDHIRSKYQRSMLIQRLRSSPPSSRSSFSIGSNSSFYKSANEPTPSPLPLLPAFLQEVVGETSESSSSSVHDSPSPPSPSSTSSAFGNTYSGDPRLSELVGAGLRRRERSSPASGAPQISNNIHRTASHSSIWSFGYPGDHKEGIRPV